MGGAGLMTATDRSVEELLGDLTPVAKMDGYGLIRQRDQLRRKEHDRSLTEFERAIIHGRLLCVEAEWRKRSER